jgi:hypothetical protein
MAKPPAPKQPNFRQPPPGKSVLGPFSPTVPETGNTFYHDIQRIVKVRTETGYVEPKVGSAHPDTNLFPNHVLIIPPIAQENGIDVEWIYGRLRQSADHKLISEFGGGDVSMDQSAIIDPETKPTTDQGYLITESQVTDQGSQRFLKETTTLDELDAPSLELTNGGSGFTSNPTVVFDSGAAVATAKVRYAVTSIGISNGGNGYGYPPAIAAYGDGYGLVALPVITAGVITSVVVISGGRWAQAPTLQVVGGGGGSGAVLTATNASTGIVDELTLTTPGTYNVAPNVSFAGGGGTLAAATYNVPDLEWPVLYEVDTDPTYGLVVDVTKQVIPAGQPLDSEIFNDPLKGYIDIKSLERWRSIQIQSKIDLRSLPKPITWGETFELDLPATLLDVVGSWANVGGSGGTAESTRVPYAAAPQSGINATSTVIAGGTNTLTNASDGGILSWATINTDDGVSGGIEVLVRHNFRGIARAEVTRIFFFGPPSLAMIPAITRIIPVTGTATLIGKYAKFTRSQGTGPMVELSNHGQIETKSLTFGPFLSGGFSNFNQTYTGSGSEAEALAGPDIDGTSYDVIGVQPGSVGTLHVNIPTSDPVDIVSGLWLCLSARVEEWKFGVFVLHVIQVQVP